MADLTDEITTVASEPKVAKSDGQEAQAHPLPDLIAADRYLKGQTIDDEPNSQGGPRSGWGRVRMARAVPPGTDPGPAPPGVTSG